MKRVVLTAMAVSLLAPAMRVRAQDAGDVTKRHGWKEHHPRQAGVLNRANRERRRINGLYKQGKINAQQRDQLLAQANGVKMEDRADAQANGGFITKGQQSVMNKQENGINQEIKQDAGNAAPAPAAGQ